MYSDCLHGQHLDLCKQSKGSLKTYKNGTPTITGTQSLFKTKEI
jgi:hypothetical protein